MKSPRFLLKIELLLISVVISWIVLEVAIKVMRPQIGWMQRPDPLLGWSSPEFREFDPAAPRPPGAARILFLGDSFLAGSGVSHLRERFPCVLGAQLGPGYEVGILASGGWGTDQEVLAFQTKGAPWRPDLVVLAFCANNDISNNVSHNHGADMPKPYFVLDDPGGLTLHDTRGQPFASLAAALDQESWPRDPLWKHSYLLGFVAGEIHGVILRGREDHDPYPAVDDRYKQFLNGLEQPAEIYRGQASLSWAPQAGIDHVSAYIRGDYPLNTYQWHLCERLLELLKGEVEAAGGRLAVMLLPVIFNPRDPDTIAGGPYLREFDTPQGPFTFRSAEPRDRLAGICRRQGIDFLDPTAEFRARVIGDDLLTEVWPRDDDRHFSDLGHRILARQTRDLLAAEGILSR